MRSSGIGSGIAGVSKRGESLLVMRDDQPVAQIQPVAAPGGQRRPFGLCAGEFSVPAEFDEPLPEHLLEEFEG